VPDVLELVVTLGDTTLEHRFVALAPVEIAGVAIDPAQVGSGWVRRTRGLVEVAARRAAPPRPHALGAAISDRRSLGYIAASLAVHLIVWAVASEAPPEPTLRIEPIPAPGARVVGTFAAGRSPQAFERGDSPDVERDGGGKPSLALEGRAGGGSKQETGHARLARRDRPAVTRTAAIEAARQAGVLGSTALAGQGFAALVGTADLASGFDTVDAQAPLYGGAGAGAGSFGLGRIATGDGAGCLGGRCDGLIGSGRYGTISNGRSVGDHWGGGRTGASGGIHREPPTIRVCGGPGPCIANGALDKEVIRRYIRRQLAKLQYCYEKELLAAPELDGTVDTHFLISQAGTVTSVEASGVSPAVAACVGSVIEHIEFPRAIEGSTEVRYLFTFRRPGT